MTRITINGVSFDPDVQAVGLAVAGQAVERSPSSYLLIQTRRPLSAADRAELKNIGVEINEYVPTDTYICHCKEGALASVRLLSFVRWADVYLEGFKITPRLLNQRSPRHQLVGPAPASVPTSMSQEPRFVDIVFHRNVDTGAALAKVARAARVDDDALKVTRGKVRVLVPPQALDRLARLDEVRHIEEYTPPKLHTMVALRLIAADQTHAQVALKGRDQVIAVCDTGFDLGLTDDVHPAFRGRVKQVYALGRPTGSDPHGHGTHVAGSVLGDGSSSAMGGSLLGSAPQATLVMQSVYDRFGGLGGLPENLNDLLAVPYLNDGARVHTNSWGTPGTGEYGTMSYEVDEFIWNHRDMVVLFSAGNEGTDRDGNGVIDGGTISSPGTAKNCITVGASESDRASISKRYGDVWPGIYPADPVASDHWADDPDGIAAFSSRGPTRDGRIKPDLVAPGTAILSAHSRRANINSFWGRSEDPLYCFMGGTSMATPIVAGCAALVREFLGQRDLPNPSAALVKAMLINAAKGLRGQYTPSDAGSAPNFVQGFGRVDMSAAVGPRPDRVTVEWHDEREALDTGDEWRRQVRVDGPGSTLKVTLVWTDPPGETLQNDLDLIVRAASGEERHGNMAPHSSGFDRHNNVEQVEWVNVPAGVVDVIVTAHRIARERQTFALVVRRVKAGSE
jgi:serine protease AprX